MGDHGTVMVWLPLAISFGSDTFALFAGMACGKHKLAPHVSPKKTVEGGVGGVLGGGITYLSFKPCCDKLKASLQNTILSNPDYQNSETEDAILAEFADVTTSGYEAVP